MEEREKATIEQLYEQLGNNFDITICSDIVNGLYFEYKQLYYENEQLKEQLEYLRSGEYLNQLKFERDMLQDVVDKMEVSKEDKDFIDMTHRNTELLEENKKYKEVIDKIKAITYEIDESTKITGGYPSNYIDDLLDILKEVK